MELKILRTVGDFKVFKDFKDFNAAVRKNGNYKQLLSYQKSQAIYDMTFYFCTNYIRRTDRTFDQMVQAARSGKQNIVEGCAASSTSSKSEIRLINVAKASLMELLEDYKDYLLFKQLQALSDKFLEEGGFSERMARMRLQRRNLLDPKKRD